MRWAVEVPAFMIHMPPLAGLSGNPMDAAVAPGTATVMCRRAVAWSGPFIVYQTAPNSGFTRVPLASAASIAACLRGFIQHGLKLPVLRDPVQIANAGALHGERRASRLAGAVVTDQAVGAFLNGVVGAVGLPLDTVALSFCWAGAAAKARAIISASLCANARLQPPVRQERSG